MYLCCQKAAIANNMDLKSIYKRLGLEGSDALITISSDDEWKKRLLSPAEYTGYWKAIKFCQA